MCMKLIQLFLSEKYYKMFFLMTNLVVRKYYSRIVTQFIIGCTCYIVIFFIIKDLISENIYEKYKYYVLFLIIVDTMFLLYSIRTSPIKQINTQPQEKFTVKTISENIISDTQNENTPNLTLSSEINDFKITHDITLSDTMNNTSLFSTSESDNDPNKKVN